MSANRTIHDVARLAGVSPATVSMVINNRPSVRASTAQKVRQVMEEIGYVPPVPGQRRGYRENPNAGRKTNRIALVVSSLLPSVMESPVYAKAVNGAISAAQVHDKSVLIYYHNANAKSSPRILTQRVDGVLLFGNAQDPVLLRALQKQPCVQMMGIVDPSGLFDHVTYDNLMIGKLAADYLLAQSHRHCAFMGNPDFPDMIGQRGATFRESILRAGGELLCLPFGEVIRKDPTTHTVDPVELAKSLDVLLAASPRPSALFLPMDILTYSAYLYFYQSGVIPGQDLTIVSCNNEESLLAHTRPRPAVVDLHAEMVGFRAFEQLLWRIAHPIHPRVKHLLEPTLVPA